MFIYLMEKAQKWMFTSKFLDVRVKLLGIIPIDVKGNLLTILIEIQIVRTHGIGTKMGICNTKCSKI